jgi:hypothetical protein
VEAAVRAPAAGRQAAASFPAGRRAGLARAQVTLTGLGREVLAGATDRLAVAPIDRWLGGTHLLGDRDWRWDAAAGVLRP